MEYYRGYELRYRAAYDAGVERWGYSPDDEELRGALTQWVLENGLIGKRVIEYACGEGAGGVILSSLGCEYTGVDLSELALAKAREALAGYPNARVLKMDMAREKAPEIYDAALDIMGLHMLVTDPDREAYLRNSRAALRPGAPALFYRESFRENADNARVETYADWLERTGNVYSEPEERSAPGKDGGEVTVWIPRLPARARSEAGYRSEMRAAGFSVTRFAVMEPSRAMAFAASVYTRAD